MCKLQDITDCFLQRGCCFSLVNAFTKRNIKNHKKALYFTNDT